MSGDLRNHISCDRTAVDKELHTARQGVDGRLDRLKRLVVWDRIRGPCEHHDTELHGRS
jgi:hypothetical protein